jgi:hypothetical protein
MSLRVQAALAVGICLIVLPVIIVRAQAEGEIGAPPPTETVEETTADTTVAEQTPEESEATAPAAEEGSVLGAETSTETESSLETGQSDHSATSSDVTTAGDEGGAPAPNGEAASTTAPETLALDTASSTASSTEPVADPPAEVPKEEPFVLQAAVDLQVDGSSISADVQLENLTCKACEKVLPAAHVKTYYTAWYPNDGPDLKEVGERFGEQDVDVSDVALWSSRTMTWSASDIAPGRYYFVIVVDPENAIDAYRMQRMEFSI